MTKSEALVALGSQSTHERLKAARHLAKIADHSELAALREANQRESDRYVKGNLERAIERLSHGLPAPLDDGEIDTDIPTDVLREVKRRAVEEISGLILHEIGSRIGLLKRAAARDIEDFEASDTKRHLGRLNADFEGIEHLKSASAQPKRTEFDLADLLRTLVDEEEGEEGLVIKLHGLKPLNVVSDRGLLRIAVANGLRNAIEATCSLSADSRHPIVVTWGVTDIDCWVAIIDRGPGVVGSTEHAFELFRSTKKGNSGMGLAVARQCIETLDGTVTLQPGDLGGARYELRWRR